MHNRYSRAKNAGISIVNIYKDKKAKNSDIRTENANRAENLGTSIIDVNRDKETKNSNICIANTDKVVDLSIYRADTD